MLGGMQNKPLLVSSLLQYAAQYHGDVEIVSKPIENVPDLHRYSYRELSTRSRQLARALTDELGVVPGDRIATLAWNGYRHLELYFGISGMGAIVHTVNPRLFEHQISWIL